MELFILKNLLLKEKLQNTQEVSHQYNNHNNTVKFHKDNTSTQVYILFSLKPQKVRYNNYADFWIILNIYEIIILDNSVWKTR